MYKYLKNTGVFLSFCMLVSISNVAYSKQNSISWLDAQINKDPEVIEARELLNASNHHAKSLTQAVYNPELDASFEKEGDFNNYSIGLRILAYPVTYSGFPDHQQSGDQIRLKLIMSLHGIHSLRILFY